MKRSPHTGPVAASLTLHAVVAALLIAGVGNAVPQRPQPKIIQAAVVDVTKLSADLERIAEEVNLAELEDKQEQEKREAEERRIEEERVAKIKRDKEEAERKEREAELEKKRVAELEIKEKAEAEAEKKRLADLEARRKADADAKLKAEAEAKKKADAEALAKRKADEAKKKAEAEAKAKADAERRQREAEEALQAQLEAELKTAMAAEEQRTAAVDAGLLDEYVALIRQKVQRNWIKPASAPLDINCEVSVRQIPGGEVVDVRVLQCNGDPAVVRSIEAAVRKASPLPEPRDASIFQRNLKFRFIPEESG